jgi:glycine cleavage system aminomethyltransferase T
MREFTQHETFLIERALRFEIARLEAWIGGSKYATSSASRNVAEAELKDARTALAVFDAAHLQRAIFRVSDDGDTLNDRFPGGY